MVKFCCSKKQREKEKEREREESIYRYLSYDYACREVTMKLVSLGIPVIVPTSLLEDFINFHARHLETFSLTGVSLICRTNRTLRIRLKTSGLDRFPVSSLDRFFFVLNELSRRE